MKTCPKCGVSHEPRSYMASKGDWRCIACYGKYQKSFMDAKRERLGKKKRARQFLKRDTYTKEERAAYNKKYREVKRGLIYGLVNKERNKAREALNYAVKSGEIEKPTQCFNCGCSPSRLEGHHHKGYCQENWLDVMWLCVPCHRTLDMIKRRIKKNKNQEMI